MTNPKISMAKAIATDPLAVLMIGIGVLALVK
jgi:hypothetical protein